MEAVAKASTDSAGTAVELAIGLIGVMAFWIGAVGVLHKAGFLRILLRVLKPVLVRLFPDLPPDHPALGMMVLNMAANVLGLANAATPFGLKAMLELDKDNARPGTASDSMALFLAINTSGLAVLPTGMVGLRASLGSEIPGAIFLPSIVATMCSTAVAILVCKLLQRLRAFAPTEGDVGQRTGEIPETQSIEAEVGVHVPSVRGWRRRIIGLALGVVLLSLGYAAFEVCFGTPAWASAMKAALGRDVVAGLGVLAGGKSLSAHWPLPLLLSVIVFAGLFKDINVYGTLVEGAKEGFNIAVRIIPYLVAILVAIGMFRASGALDLLVGVVDPVTSRLGMPAETLPMALIRPLSGSGAFAVAAEAMKAHGPDSMIGLIVSTMQGSTETTFYVLALYCGVVGIKRVRHALWACLAADVAGMLASVWAVRLLL
jgi:spore maturation protein SpmA